MAGGNMWSAGRRYRHEHLGASHPRDLFKHFGFTVENVVKVVQQVLGAISGASQSGFPLG